MTTISANANNGYAFDHWSDGSTQNPYTLDVKDNMELIAYFVAIPAYTVTVNNANPDMGTVNGGGTYYEGSQATITATANNGCRFISWNDGSTETSRTFTVTSDTAFTAYFEAIPIYTVTVNSNDDEMGTVSGGGTYVEGSRVTISASANDGYRFTGWNDGNAQTSRTITVTSDVTYTAYFEVIPYYTITVLSNDDEMGTVTGGGTYVEGSRVTISASANDGYRFTGWNDGPTQASRTFTVTGDATYTAIFEVVTYMLYVYSADLSMGTVTGGEIYQYGEQATFNVTAREGYHFTHWSDGSTDATRSISITGDATYTAYFEVGGTEGIDDIAAEEVRIYARGSEIVIEGAENSDALIYDVMGRIVHKGRIEGPIHVNNMGVYMVKIGNQKPQKVVVR